MYVMQYNFFDFCFFFLVISTHSLPTYLPHLNTLNTNIHTYITTSILIIFFFLCSFSFEVFCPFSFATRALKFYDHEKKANDGNAAVEIRRRE